jgi:hypothetical protein
MVEFPSVKLVLLTFQLVSERRIGDLITLVFLSINDVLDLTIIWDGKDEDHLPAQIMRQWEIVNDFQWICFVDEQV